MPSTASTAGPQSASERPDTLALLFQGIFTGIVRIQAGKQPLSDLDTFRGRIKVALQEVEREGVSVGYSGEELRNARFAIVALLDESILSSKEPGREQWRTQPLNAELFGEAIAGEVFYERLAALSQRPDSDSLADLLEIYLLCLLLGFEGRMSGPLRGEVLVMADKLRRRIESIRGSDYKLSPPPDLVQVPQRLTVATPYRMWSIWAGALIGVAVLLFAIYWVSLDWSVTRLEQAAAR